MIKRFFYLDLSNRNFGLDLLRFLAIMFVMTLHAGRFFPEAYIGYYTKIIYDGVGIFFVLSGFLIGGILLKQLEISFDFRSLIIFWYKRWSRTLPNYYLFLLVTLIFHQVSLSEAYPYFLFLQNLTSPIKGFFGWSWSLSVEEWFYLSIPLIIYIITNYFKINSKKSFLITLITVITGGLLLRLHSYRGGRGI